MPKKTTTAEAKTRTKAVKLLQKFAVFIEFGDEVSKKYVVAYSAAEASQKATTLYEGEVIVARSVTTISVSENRLLDLLNNDYITNDEYDAIITGLKAINALTSI